jgi:hypothetical protein
LRLPFIVGTSLLLVTLAARFATLFKEAVNWDEFAALARADRMVRLGEVDVGGRPGLMNFLLAPFVRGCSDSVASVVDARILWYLITLLYLAGVFALVARWHASARRPTAGRLEALFAVLLLACLPAFVTWSVQVRSDQAALAAAVWGGVLLLGHGARSSAAAGVLFGIAFLCTQKGLYPIAGCFALLCTAALGRTTAGVATPGTAMRDAARSAFLAIATAAAVVAVYFALVPEAARIVTPRVVSTLWNEMNTVRGQMGYGAYLAQAPHALVHLLLFAVLLVWTARCVAARDRDAIAPLVTSWVMLALAVCVALVHGSTLAYFLMTLGLFPAIGLGLVIGRVAPAAPTLQHWTVTMLALALFGGAVPETLQMMEGTQANQHRTIQFIRTSGLADYRGYQVEGALFCAGDPDPMPVLFSRQIASWLRNSPQAIASFIGEFRSRPIAYMVESYRMSQFPDEVRSFWSQHYLRHSGSLFVSGFSVHPNPTPATVEVLVAGRYRWRPIPRGTGPALRVGSMVIEAGATGTIPAGTHVIQTIPSGASGTLALDVPDWPEQDFVRFYDKRQKRRLGGVP